MGVRACHWDVGPWLFVVMHYPRRVADFAKPASNSVAVADELNGSDLEACSAAWSAFWCCSRSSDFVVLNQEPGTHRIRNACAVPDPPRFGQQTRWRGFEAGRHDEVFGMRPGLHMILAGEFELQVFASRHQ